LAKEDCDLTGVGVLVTRAAHQSAPLCRLIESHGGQAITFPALEIRGPEHPETVKSQLAQLDQFDIAIFISPNAVSQSLALLQDKTALAKLKIAAVGKSTAHALAQAGLAVDISPKERFDSEALLEMQALRNVNNQKIIIFRGNGGRSLLGDTLQQRGATVAYIEVYQRCKPSASASKLLEIWPKSIHIVTATSIDILNNLASMLGAEGLQQLRSTPLIVVSARMQAAVKKLGCENILLAERADDQSILSTLCNWAITEKTP